MSYSNQITDSEAEQRSQDVQPEPYAFYRSLATFPQPNVHAILPAPGNAGNFYLHHPQYHQEGALVYGKLQYDGVQYQHPATNLDPAIASSSNHYNHYMAAPSAPRDFPIPVNHGQHEQLPFASTQGNLGVNEGSYGRNNPYVDGVGGSFKRKNAEGIPVNFQYQHALVGSSFPLASMNAASFVPPEYRGNGSLSFTEDGAPRGMNNHQLQGNYVSQACEFPGNFWSGLQFNSSARESETWAWNHSARLPYLPGDTQGCEDGGNISVRGYQVTNGNGGLTSFIYPSIPQGHPNLRHLPPHIQGVRPQFITLPPQMTASSQRHLPSSSFDSTINPFALVEAGSRYIRPFPPTAFRLYRPQRGEFMLGTNTRLHNLPNMRVLPEDGVAMLDIPGYHEVRDSVDQHREMRMDVDHMSYEELLALGEQIGTAKTGLSEEVIVGHLKTRSFSSAEIPCNLENAACLDHKTDFCVICQSDYKDQENVGTLDCGHEYHAECVTNWLILKNNCPICKSTALCAEAKDS
ncbi:probable E3 ubiquitin-protein ligase ZFP1 [Solanum pennellii]|uniref:RING-type E3 ubiquitin transferase n=1 Tax=Solanum pennellii TaxID=28526 RepID=A0ABM1UXI3_SOLPN|nr:probable E3 ubiquitin-protein ligase ZFP1 [Solanum pennellii]XP_027768199.1 probable E3 ubiquitin-protein ligase ZFP1 [Solanum pennellii]XP_027768200.1 probable E3 ubiquitin-protein ligase ZFP1 [Solanum pennellii]XP_027768201.1 probable E3 ubiquitin-protein ligase ZFP1 [Solanum pennellii]